MENAITAWPIVTAATASAYHNENVLSRENGTANVGISQKANNRDLISSLNKALKRLFLTLGELLFNQNIFN